VVEWGQRSERRFRLGRRCRVRVARRGATETEERGARLAAVWSCDGQRRWTPGRLLRAGWRGQRRFDGRGREELRGGQDIIFYIINLYLY
jgi:hypothetical protein